MVEDGSAPTDSCFRRVHRHRCWKLLWLLRAGSEGRAQSPRVERLPGTWPSLPAPSASPTESRVAGEAEGVSATRGRPPAHGVRAGVKPAGGAGLRVGPSVPGAGCSVVSGFPEMFCRQAAGTRPGARVPKDGSPDLWPIWGCRGFGTVDGEGPQSCFWPPTKQLTSGNVSSFVGAYRCAQQPPPRPGSSGSRNRGNGFLCACPPLADVPELFLAWPPAQSMGLAGRGATVSDECP